MDQTSQSIPSTVDEGIPNSRLAAFSDSVFAFSAALLVVTLEVPRTYAELMANLTGFWSFGLSFIMLILIWSAHAKFFRRFPVNDGWVVVLNSLLLFVVLFYVYPLKFMTMALVESFFGTGPFIDPETGRGQMLGSLAEMRGLFLIYGAGFMAVFFCLASLYFYAWRRRAALGLDTLQQFDARMWCRHYLIYVFVGLISVLIAWSGVAAGTGISGWIYGALGPLCGWHGAVSWRRRERLEASLAARG